MRTPLSNLRLRTRLALVMFLVMASTSGILIATYVRQEQRVKAYVAGVTSDLVAISELTRQQAFPPKADPKMILQAYTDALQKNGLHVDATSPSGEVLVSSDPKQLHKKIKIRGRQAKKPQDPIQISASFQDIDVDPGAGQTTYSVQFPIVHGEKVIGYMVLHGVADQAGPLLRRSYLTRSAWILATLLAGMFAVVYLAFLFTKPVDQLVAGAEQVAGGNLYVALPASGSGEMGRLAETFNQMVERLRENRQLLERLNEAEKLSLLGRFAATVAHEVRNSLNFINLSIDQIRAKHLGADERPGRDPGRDLEHNLDNVKDEVSRMNRLVNEFLSAGRQSPPALAPCDIRATVEEAMGLVEKQARLQGIEIASDLPADLPPLQADAGQLKTCFLNILTNAIQAMPQGGEVRISSALLPAKTNYLRTGGTGPGTLQLRFADTGPGIQPGDRAKIFTPYFSTKATGFGLGLAISKKIVEEHGGRIYPAEAASGGTNGNPRGTVMVVELPLEEAVSRQRPEGSPVRNGRMGSTSSFRA